MSAPQRWVYVTGCDSGFGAIMVDKLRAMPGVGVFSGVYLPATAERIRGEDDPSVVPVRLDVTDAASVTAAAAQVTAHLEACGGHLWGVVNNAGILVNPGPVEWTPLDDYRKMFEVNVLGTVAVTKSVLPLLRQSQGRIVNVASIAGRTGLPSQPAYCASKYAVEGFSDVLRREMYPWGVSVHIIEPGIFPNTGLYGQFQAGLDKLWDQLDDGLKAEYGPAFKEWFRARIGKAMDLGNADSSMVPEAMLEALFDDKPKYRYRVGNDSKYLVTLLNMMHESTQDAVWNYGVRKKPEAKPAAAAADGWAVSTGRYASDWSRTLLLLGLTALGWKAARPRL